MPFHPLHTVSGLAAIAALASASQINQPPCVADSYTPYEYFGCYEDDRDDRSLSYVPGIEFATATIEKCTAACKANGYHYAGLEYYGECFCDSNISGDDAPEAHCNHTCNGNSDQTCGGYDRLSIWADPMVSDNVAGAEDYEHLGCWTEGYGGRALTYNQADSIDEDTLTTEICLNACGALGYPYAGTQYAQECYCGVQLDYNPKSVPLTECSMTCNGNDSQICGDAGRLNLYHAKSLFSSERCKLRQNAEPSPSKSSDVIPSSKTPTPSPSSSKPSSSKTPNVNSPSSQTPTKTSSTLYTTSSVEIPSNSYTPPPYTPTKSSKPPPAPTSSCICETPAAWSGNKCAGQIPLPCVGCNDDTNERSRYPYKLFNSNSYSKCRKYSSKSTSNACQDACKTQYTWCIEYAKTLPRDKRKGSKNRTAKEMQDLCVSQYRDCYKANQNTRDPGWCAPEKKDEHVSQGWYKWLNDWIGRWGFSGKRRRNTLD